VTNPLVSAAVSGWRRHFLASSLRVAATSTSPSFKLRKRPPVEEDAVEEPPSKRQKIADVPEKAPVPTAAIPDESDHEDVVEDDDVESVPPAEVAIPDRDSDGASYAILLLSALSNH
jgi:hypothetical protein